MVWYHQLPEMRIPVNEIQHVNKPDPIPRLESTSLSQDSFVSESAPKIVNPKSPSSQRLPTTLVALRYQYTPLLPRNSGDIMMSNYANYALEGTITAHLNIHPI